MKKKQPKDYPSISLRVSAYQKAKLALLGNGKWVKRAIDNARLTPEQKQQLEQVK